MQLDSTTAERACRVCASAAPRLYKLVATTVEMEQQLNRLNSKYSSNNNSSNNNNNKNSSSNSNSNIINNNNNSSSSSSSRSNRLDLLYGDLSLSSSTAATTAATAVGEDAEEGEVHDESSMGGVSTSTKRFISDKDVDDLVRRCAAGLAALEATLEQQRLEAEARRQRDRALSEKRRRSSSSSSYSAADCPEDFHPNGGNGVSSRAADRAALLSSLPGSERRPRCSRRGDLCPVM